MYERKEDYEKDLAAAKHPNTDGEILDKLLAKHHGEIEMARAVARNPSCSASRFADFWSHDFDAARENPNIETYQADEHWESSLRRYEPRPKPYSSYSLGISRGWPEIYRLQWIMENGVSAYQREVMAFGPVPESMVREAAGSKNAALRKTIASRKSAPGEVFEALASDRARTVRQALAANPAVPPAIIAGLATDKDEGVAQAARDNPCCPDEAVHQARLADATRSKEVDTGSMGFHELAKLASNPDTAPEKLAELADSEFGCVRFLVGFNASTPPDVLKKVAADAEPWVQAGAAFNPNTPAGSLANLLESREPDVQKGLASNPSLDEESQLKLAEMAPDDVKLTLANLTQHPSVWKALAWSDKVKKKSDRHWRHILGEVLADNFVGMTGLKTYLLCCVRVTVRAEKGPKRFIRNFGHYLFDDYRQNPANALALLEGKTHIETRPYKDWKLESWLSQGRAPGHVSNWYLQHADDDDKLAPRALSSSSAELVHVLPKLFEVGTVDRKRIAERPDLNRFAFEMLLRDEKSGVREKVAANRKCPKDLKALLKGDKATTVRTTAAGKGNKGAVTGQVVNQGSATERARLAKRTEDEAILAELVGDRAASVRLAILENRREPQNVLEMLLKDKDERVREGAVRKIRDKDVLRRALTDESVAVRIAVAKNVAWRRWTKDDGRQYDQEFMAEIANSTDVEIREVSAAQTTDPALHEQFMGDVPEVTRKLAENKHFSDEMRLALARLSDDQDTLGELARKTRNEELFMLVAEKITSSHVADAIGRNHEMKKRPHLQDILCKHPLRAIRGSFIHTTPLTRNAMMTLAADSDEKISSWMQRRLKKESQRR